MEYKKVERHISQEIGRMTAPIDEDSLIKGLGIEKKNRRFFPGFLIALPALFMILGGGYWFMNKGETLGPTHDKTSLVERTNPQAKQSAEANIISNNTPLKPSDSNKLITSNSTIIREKSRGLNKENESSFYTENNKATSDIHQNSTSTPKVNLFRNTETIMTSNETIKSKRYQETYGVDKGGLFSITKESRLLESPEAISMIGLKEIEHENRSKSLNGIGPDKIVCPSFKEKRFVIGLGIEAGAGDLMSNLSAADDITEAMQNRIENEKALEETHVKIFATAESKKLNAGLKFGLSLNRYTNRYTHEENYTVRDTTVGIISTTVSPTGDTITHIYGDIVTETTYQSVRKKHYYLYKLDVPLSVFYNLSLGSWFIQPELGAQLNVRTWSQGNALNALGVFESVEENNHIKKSVGVSCFAQVNIMKALGNGYQAYVSPYFQASPTNHMNKFAKGTYKGYGLKVGLLRRF